MPFALVKLSKKGRGHRAPAENLIRRSCDLKQQSDHVQVRFKRGADRRFGLVPDPGAKLPFGERDRCNRALIGRCL